MCELVTMVHGKFNYFGANATSYDVQPSYEQQNSAEVTVESDPPELVVDDSKEQDVWHELYRSPLSTKEDKSLHVIVKTFKKKHYVDIRKHFLSFSKWIPKKQGVCLTREEFLLLMKNSDAILKCIQSTSERL